MAPLQAGAPQPQGAGVVLVKLGQGEGLFEVIQGLDKDSSVRAVVVAGENDNSWAIEDDAESQDSSFSRLAEIRHAHMPVIACIGGNCRGAGLSLAMACDIRFAAEGVEVLSDIACKGIASGDASTHLLPQLIGEGNAIQALLAGDQRPAEKLPSGLLQRTAPKAKILDEALAFAKKVAAAAPVAAAVTKQQVYVQWRRSLPEVKAVNSRLAQAESKERSTGDAALKDGKTPSFDDFDGAQPLASLARELFGPDAKPVEPQEEQTQPAEPWEAPGSGLVKVDWLEGGVIKVTLTTATWGPDLDIEFFKIMNHLNAEGFARVIVITGSGKEFLKEGESGAPLEAKKGYIRCFSDLRSMKSPTVACINGTCRGPGFSLALACDVRYAAEGAVICAGYAQRGRFAEDNSAHMLPQLVGVANAQYMLLGGEPVLAVDAPKGLMQRVVKPADVLKESLEFAQKIAVFSSLNSMAVIKWQAYALPMRNFDEAHKATQYLCNSSLFEHNPDHYEGMRVFGTGQPPSFGAFSYEIPFVRLALQVLPTPLAPPSPYEEYLEFPKPPKEGIEYSCVIVEEHEEGVVVITLNKRTRMNAWGPDIDAEFFEVLDYYDSLPSTRVIVITGQGFFFCAGHDAEFTQDGDSLHTGTRPKIGALRDFHDIRKMRTPTIACVNGAACGIGLSLALVCDIRFACPDAKFGVIFPTRGLIGEESTAYILPHLAGVGDALPLLLTGDNIMAQDLPAGIVQRMWPRKELLNETLAFAKNLARTASPTAMAVIKQQALQLSLRQFDDALDIAGRLAEASFSDINPDRQEAISALASGRAPQFKTYDASLPFLKLARELLGGMTDRPFAPPKPRAKPDPKAATKALPKPEEKPAPKPKPAPKAGTGPQLAVKCFKVVAKAGASVRKVAAEDAPELSKLDEGDTVYLQEESFDGWAKLAEEDGWVRRCALVDGSVTTYLELEDASETLLFALPEPAVKGGPRKFKVTLKSGVGIKSEPKAKAKVQSQKKVGEMLIAEAQTYDGWIRLVRNQGWVLVVGASTGRMLEPLAV